VLAVTGIASAGAPAGNTTQVGGCGFSTSNSTWTLNGDCTTNTTISVPNGFTLNGNGHTITAADPTGGVFTGAVVSNGGAVMNVQNLTISGSSTAIDVCRDFNGVAFLAASGSVSNVTLNYIGLPATGCQQGRAILVDAIGSATQQSVKIENNTVTDYNKNGIDVRGNVAAKIDGNTVSTLPSDQIIRNGIVVRTGAFAQVGGNTVSGNSSSAYPQSATGLLVVDGATVTLNKGNTLTSNDVPMYIDGSTVVGNYKGSA
jgi:hypothetical protein